MSMLKDRRLQVLLESEQYRAIESLAAERRVSVATVVRDALAQLDEQSAMPAPGTMCPHQYDKVTTWMSACGS
jgi:hypothetical protein